MPIKINGSTSGSVTLAAPATGTDVTLTLPGTTATVATLADPTFTGNVALPSTTTIGGGTTLGAWTAYSTTLGGFTLGNGTTAGWYVQIGKTVHFRARFTFGSTSAAATTSPTLTLPVTANANTLDVEPRCIFYDVSNNSRYLGVTYMNTTLVGGLILGTSGLGGAATTTTPFTWAVGDLILFSGTYEAA